MTTSQSLSVLSEIEGESPIPLKTRRYFRRLLQNVLHELVLEAFTEQEEKEGLTQKQLAGRLEKDPAQISRWLFTAGNWEFDTLADLLLGMKVRLNDPSYTRLEELVRRLKAASSHAEGVSHTQNRSKSFMVWLRPEPERGPSTPRPLEEMQRRTPSGQNDTWSKLEEDHA